MRHAGGRANCGKRSGILSRRDCLSDVYVPGIKSRFNTEKLIEDLMRVERIPRDRTEKNIETQESRKIYWQDLGRRVRALQENSRLLFSFQNPFNDRVAVSSDENAITATATREAVEREYRFSVKQLAQSDRFLSPPLDEKTRIDEGNYTFTVGKDEISFNFRGGSLREFADALNRRGRDKIGASLIAVQPGTRSLLIESKVTGAENRLGFSGDSETLALKLGIMEQASDSRKEIVFSEDTVRETSLPAGTAAPLSIEDGVLSFPPLASASIPLAVNVERGSPLILKLETMTKINPDLPRSASQPPPGPNIPSSGSITYGGITIENNPSTAPLPEWKAPPPPQQRVDNLAVLSLSFSDGTKAVLRPITDSEDFTPREFNLAEYAGGKTITALNIDNANTHRDISVKDAVVFDPKAIAGGGLRPLNPASTAQDAVIEMEGIRMQRPTNTIADVIPGVTLTARGVTERPIKLDINADREGVKNSIIGLVGNYNRLMAEINVLTARSMYSGSRGFEFRTTADDSIIDELTYLTEDEAEEMRKRLGVFHGDSTLTQLKSSMRRIVTAPYPTDAERDLAMLAQIGISAFILGADSSSNQAGMRGYLQIDEKKLDAAIERNLPAIKQLFGSDTTGDLIVDSGVAFNLDRISQPFIERGGIISLKTGSIDSRISQDKRRIDTMDRQLAAKEAELKAQYSRMESAFTRMEQMTASLENFSRQTGNNR